MNGVSLGETEGEWLKEDYRGKVVRDQGKACLFRPMKGVCPLEKRNREAFPAEV